MLDRFLDVIAPHDCVGCSEEGAVLCRQCAASLKPAVPRCFRCEQPVAGWYTCPACYADSGLLRVTACVRYYQPVVKAVVHRLKFERARSAAADIARAMAAKIPAGSYLVVPVPTASVRVRQRGYDQACLIARELSRQLPGQCIYAPILRRSGKTRQLGQNRSLRFKQLENAYRIVKKPPARPVLLIDDVLTTGATLQAATRALKAEGVTHIEAMTFAQA